MSYRVTLHALGAAAILLTAACGAGSHAAALVRGLADGSAYVRVENAPGLLIPASCVKQLETGLRDRTDPAAVEAAVAQAACACAAGDPPMAAAIAAYAFTIVDDNLAPAVLTGARACAADDTTVAAGPGSPAGLEFPRLGGFGTTVREPCRNASPITFC